MLAKEIWVLSFPQRLFFYLHCTLVLLVTLVTGYRTMRHRPFCNEPAVGLQTGKHTCTVQSWNTQGRCHPEGKGKLNRQPKVRQQLNFEEQWNSEVVMDSDGQNKIKVNCRVQCHGSGEHRRLVLGTHRGIKLMLGRYTSSSGQ